MLAPDYDTTALVATDADHAHARCYVEADMNVSASLARSSLRLLQVGLP